MVFQGGILEQVAFSYPGDLHDPGIEPCLLHWQVGSLPLNQQGSLGLIVQFSRLVVSDSATPWTAAQQASLSITNSRSLLKFMSIELVMPSNHLSSIVHSHSCLQSFPASGSFQMSQFFTSGGQSIGVSASATVLPMNSQD